MTELSSTHTEEDRIGDWFAAQLESAARWTWKACLAAWRGWA
jgi:hypothetical protein